MRDPITTLTMLSSINQEEQIELFFTIFDTSEKVNVYIIGGNCESIDLCNSLLSYLDKRNKYFIKFVHIIDPEINSIGIDSRNGELYVNPDITYFL
jgi:hypothetical protein